MKIFLLVIGFLAVAVSYILIFALFYGAKTAEENYKNILNSNS